MGEEAQDSLAEAAQHQQSLEGAKEEQTDVYATHKLAVKSIQDKLQQRQNYLAELKSKVAVEEQRFAQAKQDKLKALQERSEMAGSSCCCSSVSKCKERRIGP